MKNPLISILTVCATIGSLHFVQAQVNQSDSLALVAVYNLTDGPNWTGGANWLTGPVDTWEGVTIANKRVNRLEVYSFGMSGELPSAIGDLDSLRHLSMSSNFLTGAMPSAIGNLRVLESLDIHNNEFTRLPDELAMCSRLKSIIAYNNNFSGTFPMFFTQMTQLTRLELGSNEFTGALPSELSSLVNMRTLGLDRNSFDGQMPSVAGMKALSSLYLAYNNGIEGDLSEIFGDTMQVYYFTFSGNNFTGCLEERFFSPDKLVYAHIEDNDIDCIDDFAAFNGMALERIRCNGNMLDFDDLEPLADLQLPDFVYSPQDKIGTRDTLKPDEGQPVMLECSAGGGSTTYQWYKDDVAIDGATDASYGIGSFDSEMHAGWYYCRASNPLLPQLTLESEPIIVEADGTSSTTFGRQTSPLEINPNPASYSIRLSGVNETIQLYMYSIDGQLVSRHTLSPGDAFDIRDLEAGLYILQGQGAQQVYSGKVIIQ